MQRLAKTIYKLNTTEGCKVIITAEGTGWQAHASLDGAARPVVEGVPIVITAADLSGHFSESELSLHLFFTEESTADANYTVRVVDDSNTVLDTIVRTPDPDEKLPSDGGFPITLWVVAS
jgi:hypothetical protein